MVAKAESSAMRMFGGALLSSLSAPLAPAAGMGGGAMSE